MSSVDEMGVIARWTIWACPDCGRDRGPIAQYVYRACECGSHLPQREVEVVPATTTRGAVEALEWIERFTSDRGDARMMEAGQARAHIHRRASAALGGQS